MLQTIMLFMSSLITVYMLAIVLRIFLSWFSMTRGYPDNNFISKITDPYINIFKRISFLRTSMMDFSPVAAILVLSVLNTIFVRLTEGQDVSFSLVLGIIVLSIWSVALFFVIFIIILIVIRIISVFFHVSSVHPVWYTIDNILSPMTYRLTRLIFKNRLIPYPAALALLGTILTISAILANKLVEDFIVGKLIALIPV
ncbi:YggT family protein [Spirochaetia bacterium 38H-sp]|uniref:YggT family protein n=1 Tax=Rarispira pelagica TaxID=3141764 RepID=A0ABU9UD50_9SPIR